MTSPQDITVTGTLTSAPSFTASRDFVTVELAADIDVSLDPVAFQLTGADWPETAGPWAAANMTGSTARLLIGPGSTYGQLAPGVYNVFAQVTALIEAPVFLTGRFTLRGDPAEPSGGGSDSGGGAGGSGGIDDGGSA